MRLSLIITCLFFIVSSAISQLIETVGISNNKDSPPFNLTGYVFDVSTGEPLLGATILLERQEKGTITSESGAYSFQLYKGTYTLDVSYTGYERKQKRINLIGDGKINLGLKPSITSLQEVVVSGSNQQTFVNKKSGTQTLTIERIRELPNIGGEVDIIRSLTLLPGISTPGEATGGFNVRGGNYDQNLILYEGATLFNPSHLFGFVSAINPSIVRSADLYKGYIPSMYGGRASSVLDIHSEKGNFGSWNGELTLGMLSSSIGVGGPVIDNKVSVLFGARKSYTNWLFKYAKDGNINNSRADFNDYNVNLSYAINEDNDFQYTGYWSTDLFQFATNTSNSWTNEAHSVKYTSQFTSDIIFNAFGTYSHYASTIKNDNEFTGFSLNTGITKSKGGSNLQLPIGPFLTKTGSEIEYYESNPGIIIPSEGSSIQPDRVDKEHARIISVFVDNEISLSNFSISGGLRYSNYRLIGPDTIAIYEPQFSRRTQNIIDTKIEKDEVVNYDGFEPRIGINYQIDQNKSIKASYNKMYQYVHLISNTTAIAPNDQWKLSDTYIAPQNTEQYTLGYFSKIKLFNVSVEIFHKRFENLIEYKDGANLFVNKNIETELFQGPGRAYGLELFLDRKVGRLNGWFSYTFSRSIRWSRSNFESETINNGREYPTSFDQPHNLSTVINYRLSKVTSISTVFSYQSGRPVTLPKGKIWLANTILGYFNERNNSRIPNYHRLDLSFKFHWPSKHLLLDGDWTLSIYNLYGRANAYSVFFEDSENGPPQALKLSIIGSAFPSLSYNLKF